MIQKGGNIGMYIGIVCVVLLLIIGIFIGMMMVSEEEVDPELTIQNSGDNIQNYMPLKAKCFPGQHMKEGECVTNMCKCENGTATYGNFCPINDQIRCSSCNVGYHFNNKSQCVINKCMCTNGVPVDDNNCEEHGADWCKSCNDGFDLSWDGYCNPPCNCENGDAFEDGSCGTIEGHCDCEFCNSGFELTDKDCCKNLCECQNGVSFEGRDCNDNPTMCKSCNEGYYLNENYNCIPSGDEGNDPNWVDQNGWNCDRYLDCQTNGKSCCVYGREQYYEKDTKFNSTNGKAAFQVCRHSCSYTDKNPPETNFLNFPPSPRETPEYITSTFILNPYIYVNVFLKSDNIGTDPNINYRIPENKLITLKTNNKYKNFYSQILIWWMDNLYVNALLKKTGMPELNEYLKNDYEIIFYWFPNASATNLPPNDEVAIKIETLMLSIIIKHFEYIFSGDLGQKFGNKISEELKSGALEDSQFDFDDDSKKPYENLINYLKNTDDGKNILNKIYDTSEIVPENNWGTAEPWTDSNLKYKLLQLTSYFVYKNLEAGACGIGTNKCNKCKIPLLGCVDIDETNCIKTNSLGIWVIDNDSTKIKNKEFTWTLKELKGTYCT